MIDFSDISVVVQGPVVYEDALTSRCLLSIRKHLPKSEIILSTWKNSKLDGLTFDQVVYSDDPGGVLVYERKGKKFYMNTNRQITSTAAGLKIANRKYAIKFRSDMILTSSQFLNFFSRYPKRNSHYAFLNSRVIVPNIFTPNPSLLSNKPFSPSDWFAFGLTEDVRNIWDIPLAPEPETSLWFNSHPLPESRSDNDTMRYRPEQYIWLSFLRKHIDVPCEHQWDYGEHNRELHELSFANNLIILSPKQIGIKFVKYGIGIGGWASFYTHFEWQELYKKYCDPDFELRIDYETQAKRLFASCLIKSSLLQKMVNWFDYRYSRFTAAWNSRNRWRNTFDLIKSSFAKNQ